MTRKDAIRERAWNAFWKAWNKRFDVVMAQPMRSSKRIKGKERVSRTGKKEKASVARSEAFESGLDAAIDTAIRLTRKRPR